MRLQVALCLVMGALLAPRAGSATDVWVIDQGTSMLHRVDSTGRVLAARTLPGVGFGLATDAEGAAWVALGEQHLMWRVSPGGAVLVAVDTESNVQSIAVAADGSVWATRPSRGDVLHYAKDGSLRGSFAVGDVPYGVAIDGTGHVWVTNSYGSSVTRLTATGADRRDFSVGFFPTGIAAHPDGTIWIVAKQYVVRMSSDGEVQAVLDAGLSPRGVAVGVDGRIWVTNQDSHDVTVYTANGSVAATFPVGAKPWGITALGDGTVWVLCRSGEAVWRLAANGGMIGTTPFEYPHAFGDLSGLAHAAVVDPDGDRDRDGFPNRLEIFHGTDPLDAAAFPVRFVRGDADLSGGLDLSDVTRALTVLFAGGSVSCPEALDVNGDARLDLGDPLELLRYLVTGVPEPVLPFPEAGVDPDPSTGLPCR